MDFLIRGLVSVLGVAAAGFALYLAGRDAGKPIKEGTLAYGSALGTVGILGALIFLGAAYFSWRSGGFDEPVPIVIFFTLMVLCLAVVFEGMFVRIRYDDRGISTSSPWRRSRIVPWYAITGYKWSEINKWHVLETRGFGRIRFSIYLRGLTFFSMALRQRVEIAIPEEMG